MNWKSIFATAIVTGGVTVLTGMALFWFQAKKPELVYTSVVSIPFLDENESVYICQIDIINTGNIVIEDVVLHVNFENGKIEDHRTLIDSAIPYQETFSGDSLALSIPEINAEEQFRILLIVKGDADQSEEPQISLRGRGVVGESSTVDREDVQLSTLLIAAIAAYVGLIAAGVFTRRGRKSLVRFLRRGPLSDSQRAVFSSAFAIQGNPELARRYSDSVVDRLYWLESDVLAAEAIADGKIDLKQDVLAVLRVIAVQKRINDDSKAVVKYNIARLLCSMGDEAFKSILAEAVAIRKKDIEERLKIDPIFQGVDISKLN